MWFENLGWLLIVGVARSLILPNYTCARLYLVVAVILLWAALGVCDGGVGGGVITLSLERAFPRSQDGMNLSEIGKLDRVSRGRMLQQFGVVDFEVKGNVPSIGLYYTKVRLGSPPKEYHVLIDTGSNLLWASCSSCVGFPRSSSLQIQLQAFDPSGSSNVSAIGCAYKRCTLEMQFSTSGCSASNQCTYNVQYADDSGTLGVYLTDVMHFETVHGSTTNTSAQVMFGCSTSRVGDLSLSALALDEIFGLGQSDLSAISQISHQGVASNVFSHCLKGNGGGILVLGEILDPSIVCTPRLPSKAYYNVDLMSILINMKPLLISQSVFSTISNNGGTIIDSGTTLAYLPQGAYKPLVDKVTQMVSTDAQYFASVGFACYKVASSISEIFPTIELNFVGGASMVLKPGDYLLMIGSGVGSNSSWCIGFQASGELHMTILGDIVLQDKIVVYDVAKERIGWADYNCSQQVTVLESPKTERGRLNGGTASLQYHVYHWIALVILFYLLLVLSL